MSQSVFRRWWFWVLAVLLLLAVALTLISGGGTARQEVPLTEFIEAARAGEVRSVEVDDNEIEYKLIGADDTTYETKMEESDTVRGVLQDAGIEPEDFPAVTIRELSPLGNFIGVILQFLPVVVIVGFLVWMVRRTGQARGRGVLFGVSETDPVCGTKVMPGTAAGSSTFQSITYRFCSPEHKQEFDSDPVKYLLER
jgi:YHS domain-containing protein